MSYATLPQNLAPLAQQDQQAALLARFEQARLELIARHEAQANAGLVLEDAPLWREFLANLGADAAPCEPVKGSTDLECHAALLGVSADQLQDYFGLIVEINHEALDVEQVRYLRTIDRELWRAKMCADIAHNLANR